MKTLDIYLNSCFRKNLLWRTPENIDYYNKMDIKFELDSISAGVSSDDELVQKFIKDMKNPEGVVLRDTCYELIFTDNVFRSGLDEEYIEKYSENYLQSGVSPVPRYYLQLRIKGRKLLDKITFIFMRDWIQYNFLLKNRIYEIEPDTPTELVRGLWCYATADGLIWFHKEPIITRQPPEATWIEVFYKCQWKIIS